MDLRGVRRLRPEMGAAEEKGCLRRRLINQRASGWAYGTSVSQPGKVGDTYWFEAYLLVCKILGEP